MPVTEQAIGYAILISDGGSGSDLRLRVDLSPFVQYIFFHLVSRYKAIMIIQFSLCPWWLMLTPAHQNHYSIKTRKEQVVSHMTYLYTTLITA